MVGYSLTMHGNHVGKDDTPLIGFQFTYRVELQGVLKEYL